MTTTTNYGTWNNRVAPYSLTVENYVTDAFGSYGTDDFDFDAIVAEYRTAIDTALPDGVSLCGDEFIGPAYDADCDFTGYPTNEDGGLDIKAIVEDIDLWAIIERHDRTA